MKRRISAGLSAAELLRFVIGVILSVFVGGLDNTEAQTLTNLWSFTGGTDGSGPHSLVQGSDGNFYGTTGEGGNTNLNNGMGWGTVFRIAPTGTLTNLHSFSLSDGGLPNGLAQGSDSNFYGTTYLGTNANLGFGTVFRMSPTGSVTVLWLFHLHAGDGDYPVAGLVQGNDGNFYGTTRSGGTSMNCGGGCGIVFRINPSGTETNLHSFDGTDGSTPQQGVLLQGSDGNFYGVTPGGGTQNMGNVFRISSSGSLTNLYSFNYSDGESPEGGLVQGSDGNFYGTTVEGGASGYGTVFRITPNGTLTNLWSFTGGIDGGKPQAGLVQGSDGDFYGTATLGGASINCLNGCGTVFRITPSGSLTNLWSFSGNDGSNPVAGLVQGSDGYFYGTTLYGGISDAGTVFRLSVPLNPPANQISGVRVAGSDVAISIPSVAGETYQLQFTTDLTSGIWSNVPAVSVIHSIGALLTVTNFGGAVGSQGFYRFDITP